MSQFTNKDIKLILSDLRAKIRNGLVVVPYKTEGAVALLNVLGSKFNPNNAPRYFAFDTVNFNEQTVWRFTKLVNVPSFPVTSTLPENTVQWPTQDQTATALQNFINRRADPWSHVRSEVK